MKTIVKIILILILTAGTTATNAQIGTVLVMNADKEHTKKTVYVKWFIEEVMCHEGVHIYRQKAGSDSWKKITKDAYKYIRPISQEDHNKDESLKEYQMIIDETGGKNLRGIALLNVLLKGIDSDVYAKYLGIMYEDQTVETGETYQYKVMKISGGNEQLIGISKEISAGEFEPEEEPQDFKLTAGVNRAYMVWKPETDRYFSVNIYRSSSITGTETQLNELPIMLSEKENKDGTRSIPEPYFTDDSLENNVTYHYRLEALDFFGRKTHRTDTISVTIKDLIAPFPPYNLRSEQDNLKTVLKWENNVSEDLFGMHVYKSTDDSIYVRINENILTKTDTSFVDIAEKSGQYFYYVASTDVEGNEARSSKILIDIPDIVPPIKPEALTAKPDTGKIHLSWKAGTDDDLRGYILYRRISGKNKEFAPIFADPVKENKYSDTLSRIAKNKFEYVVVAVDSSFNVSEFSNMASAKMPDVLAPHRPKFKKTWLNEDGNVVVEWIANKEKDLIGYHLYRKEKKDTTTYKQINKELLSPKLNQYTDKETESGKVYFYILTASDSAGNVSYKSVPFLGAIKKAEQTDSSNLKKVSVKYDKRKKAVKIKWKVNEEISYKGCVVYKKEEGSGFKPLTALITKTEFEDKEIKENKTYSYQIRLYESTGKLIKSEVFEVITEN